MTLVGGPLVEMLNYCTAVKFESFEAAESEYEITRYALAFECTCIFCVCLLLLSLLLLTLLLCLERNHWNYVTSMDEDKALQILSAKPVEFAKYPYSYM